MTVATDLAAQTAIHPICILKIDGIDAYFAEKSSRGALAGWTDRTDIYYCLAPPVEMSHSFSIKEMKMAASGIKFELYDEKESDGTSYFGKLFAPGRWDSQSNTPWRIADGAAPLAQIDADATVIPLKDSTGASTGTVYCGQETITYTGTDGDNLDPAVKGRFPCVGAGNYGATIPRPQATDPQTARPVGTVPYDLAGRRVALYLLTWDKEANAWHAEGDEELMWCGRITESITWDPGRCVWQVMTKHIVSDLDREIATNLPYSYLDGINLQGDNGRRFVFYEYKTSNGELVAKQDITVDAGHYTTETLIKEIQDELAETAWSQISGGETQWTTIELNRDSDTSPCYFRISHGLLGGGDLDRTVKLNLFTYDTFCHALKSLGWEDGRGRWSWNTEDATGASVGAGYYVDVPFKNPPAKAYQPVALSSNGAKLYVKRGAALWPEQGDFSGTRAHIMVKDVEGVGKWHDLVKGNYLDRYSSISTNTLTLSTDQDSPGRDYTDTAFVAQNANDPQVKVQNVWVPCWKSTGNTPDRGPYQQLLYALLSTGTSTFNHANYDVLPRQISVGMQSDLVNDASFLNADKLIMGDPLSERPRLVIHEPISFMELLQREAKLWGLALSWVAGQFKIVDILNPNYNTVTIDDNAMAGRKFKPKTEKTFDHVVNSYKCKISYDWRTGKFGPSVTVQDDTSIDNLGQTREVTIEHPGIATGAWEAGLDDVLRGALFQSTILIRPGYILPSIPLVAAMVNRVPVGVAVRFTSSYVPDPLGSGSMSTDVEAIPINSTWNYATHAGTVTLLLLVQFASYGDPWGPAALVDKSKANGGYQDAGYMLYTTTHTFGESGTDSDDAAAWAADDFVSIIERTPADPAAAAVVWGPAEVTKAYEADGAGILTIGSSLAAAWDPTLEYVILTADHHEVISAQHTEATYQADTDDEQNSDGTYQRYG
ncbi:MAG: hypothetical protein GY835_23910 [bacterium]|nr:hypothetical protein [bacterium]